jgi:glycosyltransferase involved in cell wall biosynthesis
VEGVKATVKVVVPTVYSPDCPTIRSRLYPLCRELGKKNYRITFFVLGRQSTKEEHGVVFKFYKNYLQLIAMVLGLKRADCDILFPCKPYSITGVLSFIVARLKGFGYVLDTDDKIFPSEINKWWRLPLYIQEWSMERLLMSIKPATTVASRGLSRFWGNHTTYIPNTVDLEVFSKKRAISDARYQKISVGTYATTIIWPAVFFQETDRIYILDIFERLQKDNENICLLILGHGEYLPNIQETVSRRSLHNIFFAGSVDYSEMPYYYARVDAGILPLRNNHYDECKGPIKLFEYMAMELPVIATPIGEPKAMVEEASCGVLIPFDDAEGAADLISRFCKSKVDMIRMGKNGRNYLEKNNTYAKNAGTLDTIFSSCSSGLSIHSKRINKCL